MADRLLTEREAAERLGMSPRYMEARRQRVGGPPFIRISSRAIRYRTDDLDEWIASRRATSTAEYREAAASGEGR